MRFEHSLRLRVTRRHKDGVTVAFPVTDGLLNSTGVLHGGVTASVVDETAWFAIVDQLGEKIAMTTSELKVNYLRPIAGVKGTARGVRLRMGKRLCVVRVDVFDAQRRLAAMGVATYILLG